MVYELNDGIPIHVTIPTGTTPLVAGTSSDVTFDIDFSTPGIYSLKVYPVLLGDGDTFNDTLQTQITSIASAVPSYSCTFDQSTGDYLGWNSEDANNDNNTWFPLYYAGLGNTDDFSMIYQVPDAVTTGDDWLYSTCLDLEGGTTYEVSFFYRVGASGGTAYPEKMAFYYGDNQSSSSMTELLHDFGEIYDTDITKYTTAVTPSTSGTYYFGFHAYSDAGNWFVAVDDFEIQLQTSLENTFNASEVIIYPNPSTGSFTIDTDFENIIRVEVLDLTGKSIANYSNPRSRQTFDISHCSNGIYFIKIYANNEIVTQRICINK